MNEKDLLTQLRREEVNELNVPCSLVDRLEGLYGVGPIQSNGEPEFGWRRYEAFIQPIALEARERIIKLELELRKLKAK